VTTRDNLAAAIKIGAVITAAPRWVGALLAAEGLALPEAWAGWWVVVSAIAAAAMAVVEGFAFSYVLEAYRNQSDTKSHRLFWFAMVTAIVFVAVMTPYIAAQVDGREIAQHLTWALLYAWSGAVGLSTILIVASVGYAQRAKMPRKETQMQSPVLHHAVDTKPDAVHNAGVKLHRCKKCGAMVTNPGNHARWECPARKENGNA